MFNVTFTDKDGKKEVWESFETLTRAVFEKWENQAAAPELIWKVETAKVEVIEENPLTSLT